MPFVGAVLSVGVLTDSSLQMVSQGVCAALLPMLIVRGALCPNGRAA